MNKEGTKAEIPSLDCLSRLTASISQFPQVIALIHYGSTARARATPLSDIDICVVTLPGLPHDTWETIMSHTGPGLDLVIREGKPLFIRNEKMWHRKKVDALRQYLDIQPLIERNTRRILKRPVTTP
ncbi:MAG: nucleotidyltransferase domain-containing protein [Methanoregula sp.]|nr:nucleotidyltransferase domain-containing protein [Methanoregula sp.]